MMRMDGISFPRAFFLSKKPDGSVGLLFRSQMGDTDSSDTSVPWLPLSGPITVLSETKIDKDRLRSVPKKPIMVEGIKSTIKLYASHDVISEDDQLVTMVYIYNSHVIPQIVNGFELYMSGMEDVLG